MKDPVDAFRKLTSSDVMDEMTAEDLREHLRLLEESDREKRDELLTDLLVQVYPTKRTQDS